MRFRIEPDGYLGCREHAWPCPGERWALNYLLTLGDPEGLFAFAETFFDVGGRPFLQLLTSVTT